MPITRRLAVSTLLAALPAPWIIVKAQGTPHGAWPERPVRVIVPSAPGGPTDIASRLIGERLLTETRQPLVIENRAGAGGMIGLRIAARAAADGYTLVMGNPGPVAVVPHIESDVGYDILTDFEPISTIMTVPIVLVVRQDLPVRTVGELVAFMRANPGKVSFGTSGAGQSPHMATELLLRLTGIDAVVSPYRGAPPAVNDLLAGTVQAMFDTTTSRPSIEAGTLRALAIGSPRRSTLMPGIPTMAEAGFPGFEISSWYILLAPAKTPPEIVRRLNGIVTRSLADASVKSRLAALNAETIPSTPEEAGAFVRSELVNWGNIVRNIRGTRPT